MNDPQRRAIYSVNSYLNIFGIPRPNFWKQDNDRLARNAIYAVSESAGGASVRGRLPGSSKYVEE